MSDISMMYNISHVDLWVLDVVGAEYNVLRGTDFSTFIADVIFLEVQSHEFDKATLWLVRKQKYTCFRAPENKNKKRRNGMILNNVCIHPDFVPSSAPGVAILPKDLKRATDDD
jgi:hypothetical protein